MTTPKGKDKYGEDQANDHALPKAMIAGVRRVSYKMSYQFKFQTFVWEIFTTQRNGAKIIPGQDKVEREDSFKVGRSVLSGGGGGNQALTGGEVPVKTKKG